MIRSRAGIHVSIAAIASLIALLVPFSNVTAADPVFVGAGDIANCSRTQDEATAKLLDGITGTVFAAGDNVYEKGSASEYKNCYGPTWGRHKSRTWPVPGNHDYETPGASGYYGYFGSRAGDPKKGYYSFNLGAWHVVMLNSNCSAVGGCGSSSTQTTWLRSDLAANPKACTLAVWHHPRFTSRRTTPDGLTNALWQALYQYGAEVVVSGHQHNYERFAPQTPTGVANASYGIRQFVVGTGGASLRPFKSRARNSQVRNSDTHGVLVLTLRPKGYSWRFVPVGGKRFTDSGSGACH